MVHDHHLEAPDSRGYRRLGHRRCGGHCLRSVGPPWRPRDAGLGLRRPTTPWVGWCSWRQMRCCWPTSGAGHEPRPGFGQIPETGAERGRTIRWTDGAARVIPWRRTGGRCVRVDRRCVGWAYGRQHGGAVGGWPADRDWWESGSEGGFSRGMATRDLRQHRPILLLNPTYMDGPVV